MRIGILIGAFLLLHPLYALAQHVDNKVRASRHMIRHWTTKDDLPVNYFVHMAQSAEGYMWFGSFHGITRFDGKEFVTYSSNETDGWRKGDQVGEICSVDRHIWFYSHGDSTVYRLNPESPGSVDPVSEETFRLRCLGDDRALLWKTKEIVIMDGNDEAARFTWDHTLARGKPLYVVPADARVVWISFVHGVLRVTKESTLFFGHNEGWPVDSTKSDYSETIKSLLWQVDVQEDGKELLMSEKGIVAYDGSTTLKSVYVAHEPVMVAHDARAKGLWFLEGRTLQRWHNGNLYSYPLPSGREKAHNFAWVREMGENILLKLRYGYYGGKIFSWRPGEAWTHVDLTRFTERNANYAFGDREGSLWLTGNAGIYQVVRRRVGAYTKNEGLADSHVYSVFEDSNKSIWIGTLFEGAQRLEKETWYSYSPEILTGAFVRSFYEDRDGALWIGSTDGIARHRKDGTIETYFSKKIDSVPPNQIMRDRRGKLWVTTRMNLLRLEGDSLAAVFNDTRPVVGLLEDANRLWAATTTGLFYSDDGGNSWSEWCLGAFSSLSTDSKGSLWLGSTGDGLTRIDGDTSFVYTREHGLHTDWIHYAIEDLAGDIWSGTDSGIMRISRESLDAVWAGTASKLDILLLDESDGLPSAETMSSNTSVTRAHDGKIWFATNGGIAVVDPSHIDASEPPIVNARLRAFEVNGETVALDSGQRFRLGPQNHITFEYIALSYLTPDKHEYRYRLVGSDDQWQTGSNGFKEYSNLEPGAYTFEVVGINSAGQVSPEPARLAFYVLPVFYQSWWFRIGLGLVPLILLGLWTRHVRTRNQLRVALFRNRVADDLHDGLGGPISAIALFMNGLKQKEQLDERDREALQRQADVAQEMVEELRDYIWSVDSESDRLEVLVERMCAYAQAAVPAHRLTLQGCESIPEIDVDMFRRRTIYMLFKEALSNAVRHAGDAVVRVEISVEHQRLTVLVADEGSGFDTMTSQGGRGLKTMRRRAAELNGSLDIQSRPGQGTRVMVSVRLDG